MSSAMAEVLQSLSLLETLKESMESNRLSEVKEAVEDLLISRINIAVVGERGEGKASLINSLRGLAPGDEGAAPFPAPVGPEEMIGYPNPKHPDFRLWDLPPVPTTSTFEPEAYTDKYKFLRYNSIFMTMTQKPHKNSVKVFKGAQRQLMYFVLLTSEEDKAKSLEEKRKSCLEVLAEHGVTKPKVYLVTPSTWRHPSPGSSPGSADIDLSCNHPRKNDAFKALVWAAASLSGGMSTIPVPFVASMVDSSIAVRILTKAQLSLCLDDESVERLAQQRGLEPSRLKGLRMCSLSVEVTKGEVKSRLAAAEKDLSTVSSNLLQMAMPRHARCASRSFAAMLQALNAGHPMKWLQMLKR
uniref:Immunity-related GTPase family, q2 n=1 Tax=Gouania willdenowi TaxID=441366 RepID=A0A8C5GX61_GOUWI